MGQSKDMVNTMKQYTHWPFKSLETSSQIHVDFYLPKCELRRSIFCCYDIHDRRHGQILESNLTSIYKSHKTGYASIYLSYSLQATSHKYIPSSFYK